MSGHDSAQRAKARMQQVRKEMSERRALRARKAAAIKQQSADSFRSQAQVAEQVTKNLAELGKRRRQAGGWGTEKVERDKDYVLGFGLEGEEGQNPYAYRPTPRPVSADDQPGGIGGIEDEEEPAAETRPADPPAPPRPAPVRTERRPARDLDDEDDFSNQSSWMTNQ
jgi:ABC-type dipeptide/oligopeptide/nickel transport system ATPase component